MDIGFNPDWASPHVGFGTNNVIMGRTAEDLGVDDFFNLLAAQLRNQDMFDPQSNTEFVSQMATFTSLRGIQIIQEYQLSQYAASHVGKHVTIAHQGQAGNLTRVEGIVSRVTFYDGQPMVVVNDVSFPLFSVMEVHNPATSGFGPGGSTGTIPDIPSAAAFIGQTIDLRFKVHQDDPYYTEVTGVVEGVIKDRDGRILFQLDDGHDYYVGYLAGVRPTVPEEDENGNGNGYENGDEE